jgi:hypothetical protein
MVQEYYTEEIVECALNYVDLTNPIGVPKSRHEGRLTGTRCEAIYLLHYQQLITRTLCRGGGGSELTATIFGIEEVICSKGTYDWLIINAHGGVGETQAKKQSY